MQTVLFEDFSGGLTDYPMNAGKNKCKALDNILLRQYEGGAKPFTRPGSSFFTSNAPRLPTGAQKVSTLIEHKGILFAQSGSKLFYYSQFSDNWAEVKGATLNDAFPEATASSSFTYGKWNYHLLLTHTPYGKPKKVYIDELGVPKILEAGLPKPKLLTTVEGVENRLFKILFKQTYTTQGGVLFEDYSEPTLSKMLPPANVSGFRTVSFEPVVNGSLYNYDTENIKVEIYCTTVNGTTFYLAGEGLAKNGTISIPSLNDDYLATSPVIYTTGGVQPNSEPPPSNSVHIVDEVAYYGDTKDKSITPPQEFSYRLMASIAADIDSVPESFYIDLDDEIVGVSSTKSNVVALCRFAVYRVSNNQDELGQGSLGVERISDTASCASSGGIVQTLYGVFWAGYDGVYYTDGYDVKKLNQEFDITYKSWTHTPTGTIDKERASKIQGRYNRQANTITWSIQEGRVETDKLYILDLKYGIRENSSFTTWSGGESFMPTAIEYIGDNLIRGDARGYVFKHDIAYFTDKKVNVNTAPSTWTEQTIIYDITTIDYDFGTSATRKYIPQMTVACEGTTNLSLQIIATSDAGRVTGYLKPIRSTTKYPWGVDTIYWGSTNLPWNSSGSIHEKRRLPAKSLRANYKSFTFTNAKVALVSSDQLGLGVIDSNLNTLTITGLFPASYVGYYLALEPDGYVTEYEIISVSGGNITVLDPLGLLRDSSGVKWVIRGHPKGEVLNLLNVVVNFEMFGPTQGVYTAAQSGEVK